MFVTPFTATLLGFLLAGERPDPSTVAGGIVILSGMLVFYYGEKVRQTVRYKKIGENCRK
jgi:drug/metabolite transporter (DMT)-like permease